jgi:PAS domain S-box-containing protein
VNNDELDPVVEVAHLRHLLDMQPGCLLRLADDGTVLAANDAALMLLGERSRADALGRDFALWIPPDQQDRWKAFAGGVVSGSRSSIECDIQVPSGARQPILVHATPLTDHPDGARSMVVVARVISTQRQLEAAAHELKRQLQERDAEIQARRQALVAAEAARAAADAQCARALADVRQLEIALEQLARRRQPTVRETARVSASAGRTEEGR